MDLVCGDCGAEGHTRRTCTNKRGALPAGAQEDALTTAATYDGRDLKLNGRVLGPEDERRRLVTHVRVLPGVTAILERAFYRCTSLSAIVLPKGLATIGVSAFAGCTSLSSVVLPEGLTTIGYEAFTACTSLSSISFPEGLVSIRFGAFSYCSSLSSIILRKGLTAIGISVFYECTSLSSVLLPEGLATIGGSAFYGCTSLFSISIPSSVSLVYSPRLDDAYDDCDEADDQRGGTGVEPEAFVGCTLLSQRSAAKRMDVERFLRWRRRVPNQRYAVLASLARRRFQLYARQAKRARRNDDDDDGEEEEEQQEEQQEQQQEQAGVLDGVLAFDIIHSDDLWRHILEFL